MSDLDVTNWITIISWPIIFILGLLSALIITKYTKKKKVLSYAIISEIDVFTPDQFIDYEIPINIDINGISENSLSTTRLRIGNRGNTEITNFSIAIRFGEETKLHFEKLICDSKSYEDTIEITRSINFVKLDIGHLNKGQTFEIDFILSNHTKGEIQVELAEPGVMIKKIDPIKFDFPVGLLSGVSIGLFGLRTDPSAQHTKDLVEELSRLRKIVETEYYLKMHDRIRGK